MVRDKRFYATLLSIALPVALQSLITLGVVMLDNIMVGSLGDAKLAGVALANQLTTLFTFFVRGVSGGAAVLISQYWGKQDTGRIKSVFAIVSQVCLAVAVVVTVLVRCFPQATMGIFTDKPELINEGVQYISIVCFSYLLFTISDTFVSMLRCVEIVKVTLYISISSLFVNLIFNYVLIFGKFGFPEMGTRGAALATVITRVVELAIVLFYTFRVQQRIAIRPKDLLRIDRAMLGDFARYGAPIIAGDLQWGLVGMFKATIIGRLGTTMVAAQSIAAMVMSLAGIFTAGLGNAACVMIGKSVGEGDYQKTRQYSNTLQVLFAVTGVAMGLLVFVSRAIPVSFYQVSQDTANLAVTMIGIGAFTIMGTFYHATCFTGINRGAGDGKFVFKVDMVCGWLIVLPLTYLAAMVWHWPYQWVFLCLYIDQCFKWLIALIRLRGNRWIRNVTRA